MHLQIHASAVEGGVPVTLKAVEDQGSFKIVTAWTSTTMHVESPLH
jgi:hypothetical protein